MSSDYEISAWSEIERVDRFLDAISLPTNETSQNRQIELRNEKSLAPNDEPLAVQYYDLLNFTTIEAGFTEVCNYSDIEQGALLGVGTTMAVHRGLWQSKTVAIKKINVNLYESSQQQSKVSNTAARIAAATLEIRLMTNDYLKAHANIIDLLAIAWEELPENDASPVFRPVLLVELAVDESGQPFTLDTYMAQHKGSLGLKERTEILCDIASGLAAIHALSVVHSDMKPSNILMCWNKLQGRFVAKLSDFGFSSIESEGQGIALGTFLWTAPECLPEASEDLKNFKNTTTRDIYGFGLIIWYMLFGRTPFYKDGKRLDDKVITAIKLGDKMVTDVEDEFKKTYRVRDEEPERWDDASSAWVPDGDALPHTLRAYMMSFLFLDPGKRFLLIPGADLQAFATRIWDWDFLRANYELFLTNAWDAQWHDRLLNVKDRMPPIDWLRREGRRLHPLRLPIYIPTTNSAFNIISQANKHCPELVKRSIFEAAIRRAARLKGSEKARAAAMVSACYIRGFGVEKNKRASVKWCKLGADLGDVNCMYQLILFHHEGLATGNYVKIDRHQLMEYVCELLFASFTFEGETYFGDRLDKSGYLKLKDVICTRPSPAFSGIWPVMNAFISYIMLKKEVNQSEVLSVVGQFSSDPNLRAAAGAILKDEPLTLDEIILQNPETLRNNSEKGQTLLHLAALLDRGGLTAKLISHYAMDPFVGDKDGISPVELALHMGSMRAAQAIIHYTLRCDGYQLSSKRVDLLRIMQRHLYEGDGIMTSTILLWTLFAKDEKVFTDKGIRQTMINDLLQRAIRQGSWFAFCNFLYWGANPNYIPPTSRSQNEPPVDVLTIAVMFNQPVMAAVLLALGADPDGLGRFGAISPLHFAAVGSGYDHDALGREKETLYSHNNQFGHVPTFLHLYPCHSSDLQRFSVHVLLKYGADIELPENSGRSPLSGAITASQYTQSAMFLLDRKYPPDINSADFAGFTALHHTVKENNLQRVDFCLKFGADPERKDLKGRTALAIAAGIGHLRICQRLLHAGANIAAKDANGNNCLELALHSEELTRFFLEVLRKGPDDKYQNVLNNRDHQGRTIVHVAVTSTSNKRVPGSVLKLLLAEGVNPFLSDHIGYSPLHWVMATGDPESTEDPSRERFEILLGNNPTLAFLPHDDILGLTPVHFFVLYRRSDLFSVVEKYALLTYSNIADNVKGLLLPMTAMNLLDKAKHPTSTLPSQILRLIWKLSRRRAPMFCAEREISEYRSLERIINLRKQAFYGPPEVPQIEYDYFASGEMVETFISRHAWVFDQHGRHKGNKYLSTFTDDHLNPRVWIIDDKGEIRGVAGNPDGSMRKEEKEFEGWSKERWAEIEKMMMDAFKKTGVAEEIPSGAGNDPQELVVEEWSKSSGSALLGIFAPPKQADDGEWIWPENGCEVSGMEEVEEMILGGLANPTDEIVWQIHYRC